MAKSKKKDPTKVSPNELLLELVVKNREFQTLLGQNMSPSKDSIKSLVTIHTDAQRFPNKRRKLGDIKFSKPMDGLANALVGAIASYTSLTIGLAQGKLREMHVLLARLDQAIKQNE